MLSEAIEYPLEGDEAMKRLAIGGGIYLASTLIGLFAIVMGFVPLIGLVLFPMALLAAAVPGVVLTGYSVAVSRSLLAGEATPPAFTDWGGYLRDGLAVAAIAVLYALPGLALAVLGVLVFAGATMLPRDLGGAVMVLVTLAGGLVAALYSMVYVYALPAAMVTYARTDELRSAWDTDAMRPILTHRTYGLGWGGATVVLLAANSAGSSLTFVLVGFAVFFYGQLAATYLYTEGAKAALDADESSPEPTGGSEAAATTEADAAAGETSTGDVSPGDPTGDGSPGDPSEGASFEDPTADAAESDPGARGDDRPAATGAVDEADDDTGAEAPASAEGIEGAAADSGAAVESVSGVGPTTAETLRAAGYEDVVDLRAATREELTDLDGIGPARADRIKSAVQDD